MSGVFQTAGELGPLLRAGRLSPVEVVRGLLDHIDRFNPRVNAYLTVTGERALAEAREAEREMARGAYRGPLHGIPYAVKDLIATQGIRTTNGCRVTENWVPTMESTVTARMRAAGAILMGKLNLVELAMGSGQKGLHGPARNPWDERYSPSGSSSGSGAALAAGMAVLTIGTDTGGSIRGPAKSCGVVGLKPTYGRVSRFGVTPLSWTLDHVGPMARSVGDVARMLQVMAGADPADPTAAEEVVPAESEWAGRDLRGMRVGVPAEHFFRHVDKETEEALRRALDVLRGLGAELKAVEVRDAGICGAAAGVILGAESAAVHEKKRREQAELLDPLVRERLEAGALSGAGDYIRALRVRTVMMEEMRRVFGLCDVLMLPAGNAAPRLEEEIVETDAPPAVPRKARPDVFPLANLTGIPAIVLPCGFTVGPPVLPLGIQFCARPFGEGTLFRVASAYEQATDWHRRRPPMFA